MRSAARRSSPIGSSWGAAPSFSGSRSGCCSAVQWALCGLSRTRRLSSESCGCITFGTALGWAGGSPIFPIRIAVERASTCPCSEGQTPNSNGLARDFHAPLERHLLDVAKAQAEAKVEPHAVGDVLAREAVTSITRDCWGIRTTIASFPAQVDRSPDCQRSWQYLRVRYPARSGNASISEAMTADSVTRYSLRVVERILIRQCAKARLCDLAQFSRASECSEDLPA